MNDKQKAKRVQRRWDKVLAKHYGIPKMWRQYAKKHGSSTEMLLSILLQQNVIVHKPLPEDKEHPIYWRQA
jgi:hypothetical protein